MLRTPRVLVVNEDENLGQSVGRLLLDKGFETKELTYNDRIILQVKEDFPDIILLDIASPDSEGIEICREIKRTKRTSNIPIIMFIPADDGEYIRQPCEAGADSFIIKPFEPQKLLIRIIQQLCVTPEALVQKEDYGFHVG